MKFPFTDKANPTDDLITALCDTLSQAPAGKTSTIDWHGDASRVTEMRIGMLVKRVQVAFPDFKAHLDIANKKLTVTMPEKADAKAIGEALQKPIARVPHAKPATKHHKHRHGHVNHVAAKETPTAKGDAASIDTALMRDRYWTPKKPTKIAHYVNSKKQFAHVNPGDKLYDRSDVHRVSTERTIGHHDKDGKHIGSYNTSAKVWNEAMKRSHYKEDVVPQKFTSVPPHKGGSDTARAPMEQNFTHANPKPMKLISRGESGKHVESTVNKGDKLKINPHPHLGGVYQVHHQHQNGMTTHNVGGKTVQRIQQHMQKAASPDMAAHIAHHWEHTGDKGLRIAHHPKDRATGKHGGKKLFEMRKGHSLLAHSASDGGYPLVHAEHFDEKGNSLGMRHIHAPTWEKVKERLHRVEPKEGEHRKPFEVKSDAASLDIAAAEKHIYNSRTAVLKSRRKDKDRFGAHVPVVSRLKKGHALHFVPQEDGKHTMVFHQHGGGAHPNGQRPDGKVEGTAHYVTNRTADKLRNRSKPADTASLDPNVKRFTYTHEKPVNIRLRGEGNRVVHMEKGDHVTRHHHTVLHSKASEGHAHIRECGMTDKAWSKLHPRLSERVVPKPDHAELIALRKLIDQAKARQDSIKFDLAWANKKPATRDEHSEGELHAHAMNGSHMANGLAYTQSYLSKKHAKGTYDSEKAKKLWGYHVEHAAQDYHKQNHMGGKWHEAFPKHLRDHVADRLEKEHREEFGLGNSYHKDHKDAASGSHIYKHTGGKTIALPEYDRSDKNPSQRLHPRA